MRYRLVAAAAVVALGLSVTTARPAGATPLSAPQVNGKVLQYALLPDSAFGDSYSSYYILNSGAKMRSTKKITYYIPRMTCANFEGYVFAWGFGNTAGAFDQFWNPNWELDQPALIYGSQEVLQFATVGAATTFYDQDLAEYRACQTFTEPNPGDHNPGGGTVEVSATVVSKTIFGRNLAFQVTQDSALSEESGQSSYVNTLVVVSGIDVYTFWDLSGTNDEPSPALMTELIHNVQQLR
jgi:hypothetical protein